MLEKFYIVHTKNKQERKAEHNLKRQGFNVWLPTFKTSLVKRNKYINKEVPFFPGYLFVKFSLKNDSWSKINNSFGVKYLISYSGIPIPINEVLINNLKKIISGNYLKVGDYVKFVCGPLKNYKGKIVDLSSKDRIKILLDFINDGIVIITKKQNLQKA